MEPHVRSLVRYQQINLEVASLDARLSSIPAELEAIDRRQEEAAAVIKEARHRHEVSLKERRSLERDLKDLEQKIDKYNDQSREVKTNDQYRAIMSEIQTVKTRIGDVEDKILFAMEEADALEKRIGEAEKDVTARKKEFDGARKLLTEEKESVARRRSELHADRQSVAASIPRMMMDAYDRVAKFRGDLVMAAIRDERCTACNVRLRPSLVVEVRKTEALQQCESCRRLLYILPEPAGLGAESTADAKEAGVAGDPPAAGKTAAAGSAADSPFKAEAGPVVPADPAGLSSTEPGSS